MPSTWADSAAVNSSKCRSARTSRSTGSRALSASCKRRMRSARIAAWLGEVCLPSSWAASAAEQGDFPAGVAHLRAEVVPVQLQQPLADHQAQPEEQRQLRVAEILRQA